MPRGGSAGGFLQVLHLHLFMMDPEVRRPQVLLAAFPFAGAVARPLPAPKHGRRSARKRIAPSPDWLKASECVCVLLSLLSGGTPRADQRHHHHHHHGDGSHRDHDDDQKVAILLGRDAAVRRTHLTNGRLWKVHREGS